MRERRTGEAWYFEHRKLDVYRVACEFVRWVEALEPPLRGNANLRDQLRRAAQSVVLNVAEGANQESLGARRRHYRIAKGSAGECDAVLDLVEASGVEVASGRRLNDRVGAMLARLAR